MIHDGYLTLLRDQLDGADAQVIVHDGEWAATPEQTVVSEMDGILARQDVTLEATLTSGVLLVGWEETVSIDIDSAPVVGGWVLALDGASDALRVILKSAVYEGGDPVDPFPIVLAGGAFRVVR